MNVTSTIDVGVDPMTAFTAFTDELDQWWGNGPIDAWDSSRCIGRRLEPGVGGRLLELYEDDALELGRVAAHHGVAVVDSPVSGSPAAARNGVSSATVRSRSRRSRR